MNVSDICRPDVVTIQKNASVKEAALKMKDQCVGSIIVIDEQQSRPIGIITDRDIAVKLIAQDINPLEAKVSEAMSKELVIISKQEALSDAIEVLAERGIRRAPVIDEAKQLCGIITLDDIMSSIVDELNGVMEVLQAQRKTFSSEDAPHTQIEIDNMSKINPSQNVDVKDSNRPVAEPHRANADINNPRNTLNSLSQDNIGSNVGSALGYGDITAGQNNDIGFSDEGIDPSNLSNAGSDITAIQQSSTDKTPSSKPQANHIKRKTPETI